MSTSGGVGGRGGNPPPTRIRVKNTGTGIPVSAETKIFDPFFTTKPVGKGTGQGLTIAHAVVVKKHGGTFTFETEIGSGTTFFVCLPVNPAVPEGLAEVIEKLHAKMPGDRFHSANHVADKLR